VVSGPPLYVATDLASAFSEDPEEDERDIWIGQKLYRRLEPKYYAWLRFKMAGAKRALDQGRLPPAAFETLRERFNIVHAWAEHRFGIEALRVAIRCFDPAVYRSPGKTPPVRRPAVPPPPAYLYPPHGEFRFYEAVTPAAIAKVDAIREQALAQGWKIERLYQNRGRFRFPLGEDYGLVCLVDEDEQLGEVTPRYIEIRGIPPRDHLLKYYNPDANQPWHKKG
jgi:hypothetical protein